MAENQTTATGADRYVQREVAGAGGMSLTLTRYAHPDGALFWVRPDQWLAWRLRKLADRIDRGVSYAYSGTLPTGCTDDDWKDAVEYGAGATARYLADLSEDRRHDD